MNGQLRKAAPMILVAILAALLFVIRQCKHEASPGSRATVTNNKDAKKDPGIIDRDKGFDRRISYLEYSKHATCRMECRRVSKEEVEEIMQDGKINYNKSDLQTARCPRYALEGTTYQNQKLRIVFAQCNEKTEVVTVIDLDTEWSCNCPGDDKKFDNRN
jgi:hypothetical protein